MNRTVSRPVEILLVEDNPADVRLTREALAGARIRNTLHVAVDGAEALSFLRREGKFLKAPTPDLILLDLNLPRVNGHQVLHQIKADIRFRAIPVVVLTSSAADEDVEQTYREHVNCYIVKPVGLAEFLTIVKSIEDFWLEVVALPRLSVGA